MGIRLEYGERVKMGAEMTPEGQIKIAEACGWNYDEYRGRPFWDNGKERIWDEQILAERFHSIDAIREAVLAQPNDFQVEFDYELQEQRRKQVKLFHALTAADWASAFLAALEARKPQEAIA